MPIKDKNKKMIEWGHSWRSNHSLKFMIWLVIWMINYGFEVFLLVILSTTILLLCLLSSFEKIFNWSYTNLFNANSKYYSRLIEIAKRFSI